MNGKTATRGGSHMGKTRLEAFSDGVLAIIITIMVLELKVPHGDDLTTLLTLWSVALSYVLSFAYVGIYWNNHHHLFHVVQRVSGPAMWANLHLLFWLSLIPFVTGWMGENHFASLPMACYGAVLFMAACAYYLLTLALLRHHGPDSALARALGRDHKGKWSIVVYAIGIMASFFSGWLALALYAGVAIMWFVPDRRIEHVLEDGKHG
jgi:uncharacterized membrane protein